MKKLQKMSFVTASKLSRNEMRTVMAGCSATGGMRCCWPNGKCGECVTDGAVACGSDGTATSC